MQVMLDHRIPGDQRRMMLEEKDIEASIADHLQAAMSDGLASISITFREAVMRRE